MVRRKQRRISVIGVGTLAHVVELLTPAPVGEGSRVRLKQPKLPEGTWEVAVWDGPSYFEWRQQSGGVTNVAAIVSRRWRKVAPA